VVNTIKLPKALTGPISRIGWSPSSTLLLVSSGEQIDVFSALDGSFHAAINDIVPVAAKVTSVGFAASDTEIYVCSSLGLKITFHDLTTSQTVELANPKFSTPATAQNGFSFRPKTGHLAFLSRVSGKDIVSLHGVPERRVLSSWFPDTVDAAGLAWSPDGKWLAVRESAAQGHKVVFYTADGHVFKSLPNSADPASAGLDSGMTSGIKMMRFSQDGRLLAIASTSRHVAILDMKTITSRLQLSHPVNVEPGDKLQVSRSAGQP
jgi:WD40 repeat protein